MERALEIFAVVQLTVIGLSHIVFHRAWAEFFVWLTARGRAGAFINGFMSLAFGSMVVAFHQVWSGLPLVLTIVGVLNLVKAAMCFLLPDLALRSMGRVSLARSRQFIGAGVVALAIAAVTAFGLVRSA
ncbi:MAG TPA: hypothetical protein VKA54_23440 [Gemmatimonadaceae bacterium]|nr:hypothetical protein [Gemmatimonadaceae bacterium]